MKHYYHILILVIVLLSCCVPLSWSGENIWVAVDSAQLKSENSAESETLTTLPYGTALTVQKKVGKWYQVNTANDKIGWIYRGKISLTPPDQKNGEADEVMFDEMLVSSIDAYAAGSERSIRGRRVAGKGKSKIGGGLTPQTYKYGRNNNIPLKLRNDLNKLLRFKPRPEEMKAFLKKGRIGEYAP